MKIETEHLQDHQALVTAEFEQELFQRYQHRAARKISEKGKIPGFRPGKAPFDVIRRSYGDQLIQEQAVELLVDDLYSDILKEADIKPGAPGSLEKIVSTDPLIVTFRIPKEPEIELGDYHSLKLSFEPKAVEDSQIEGVLQSLRSSYATTESVDRAAENSDLVYLKMTGTILPAQDEEAEVYLNNHSVEVVIGGSEMQPDNWPYEGFSQELIGMSKGDEKTIVYEFPSTSANQHLQGKTVEYVVAVEEVKKMEFPEFNDAFAQEVGTYESLDDLKTKIRESLTHRQLHEYEDEYFDQLLDQLQERSTFKCPPQVIEEEKESLIKEFEQNLSRQNMDLSVYLKIRNCTREEFITDEIEPSARKRLARSMILSEIAKVEKIEITPAELEDMVKERMQYMLQSQGLDKMPSKKALNQLSSALTMDSVSRLYNQKTLDLLKSIASASLEKADETENKAATEEVKEGETAATEEKKPAKKTAKTKASGTETAAEVTSEEKKPAPKRKSARKAESEVSEE